MVFPVSAFECCVETLDAALKAEREEKVIVKTIAEKIIREEQVK